MILCCFSPIACFSSFYAGDRQKILPILIDTSDFLQRHLGIAVHIEQTVDLLKNVGQLGITVAYKLGIVPKGLGDSLKAFQEGPPYRRQSAEQHRSPAARSR